MDKGKSLFCVEGEGGEGTLAPNISVHAGAPFALEPLAIPESGQFDQTTSADFMPFWHGVGTMLDSSEWNIADQKEYSKALGSETGQRALESYVEGSGKGLLPVPLSTGNSLSPLPPPLSNPKPVASSSMLLSRRYTMEDLANLDPKRARRIITNRKSAAKCKEKKKRLTLELELKFHDLEKEIARLSNEIDVAKEGISALTLECQDLKLREDIAEESAKLQEELTRALLAEVYRLRALSGEGIV